jgi:probable phosphoglycerate mutase
LTTILLIQHAINDFVRPASWSGRQTCISATRESTAEALGSRLADAPIKYLYSSPLERTIETAKAICKHHPHLEIHQNYEFGEVRYGDWQGMKIASLLRRKMWSVVQEYPSRASFPNGETMRGVQVRAVNEVERLVSAHPREMVAVVTHADVIKMVLAHYLGTHLDNFQRIVVSPASISTLVLEHGRPFVATMNDVAHLLQIERERKKSKQKRMSTTLAGIRIRNNHDNAKYQSNSTRWTLSPWARLARAASAFFTCRPGRKPTRLDDHRERASRAPVRQSGNWLKTWTRVLTSEPAVGGIDMELRDQSATVSRSLNGAGLR